MTKPVGRGPLVGVERSASAPGVRVGYGVTVLVAVVASVGSSEIIVASVVYVLVGKAITCVDAGVAVGNSNVWHDMTHTTKQKVTAKIDRLITLTASIEYQYYNGGLLCLVYETQLFTRQILL
ncbi:MAG: hypothetical protein H6656_22005 [Ardenticatenaceae bacterium]|nr:hypothetical protein [Ardenticatenaceae bacterium]